MKNTKFQNYQTFLKSLQIYFLLFASKHLKCNRCISKFIHYIHIFYFQRKKFMYTFKLKKTFHFLFDEYFLLF
jgi:hypothetical protein